jgi:hypothetical protein
MLYVIFSYMSGENMPFDKDSELLHILVIERHPPAHYKTRRQVMSWIFEAYANVYGAAFLPGAGYHGAAQHEKFAVDAEGARTASYLASFR